MHEQGQYLQQSILLEAVEAENTLLEAEEK